MGSQFVDMRVYVGGSFVEKTKKVGRKEVEYQGGIIYLKCQNHVSELTVQFLRHVVLEAYKSNNEEPPKHFKMWFRQKGKPMCYGRAEIIDGDCIKEWLKTEDKQGFLDIYITLEQSIHPLKTQKCRSKFPEHHKQPPLLTQESQSNPIHPIYKVKLEQAKKQVLHNKPVGRASKAEVITISKAEFYSEYSGAPIESQTTISPNPVSLTDSPPQPQKLTPPPSSFVPVPRSTPRIKHVARKPHQKPRETDLREEKKGSSEKKSKGKDKVTKEKIEKGKEKVKDRPRAKKKLNWDDEDVSDSLVFSESSEFSDVNVDWEPGEEEVGVEDDEELFVQTRREDRAAQILREVESSLQKGFGNKEKEKGGSSAAVEEDLGIEEVGVQEEYELDSDELRSIGGSDEEIDHALVFNRDVDFKRGIQLQRGLKFFNVHTLRKALTWHAIDNRYDYYYLHNDDRRVTAYCRFRCDCEWDSKKCRIIKCVCKKNYKCRYHFHARRLFQGDCWQIRSWTPEHSCQAMVVNSKVRSEYLCERYLEEWRCNLSWKLAAFRHKVFLDLGIEISYMKAWFTRARVKLILYGNASDQYSRVWDYASAIRKYNEGSSAVVVVDGLGAPEPPIFLRMYVCLSACKEGFRKGCRPLIGVDGCHLKGAFPGQFLVAVAKDGNNNIYPFAWSVVEVENTETWSWFLDLLMRDLGGDAEGAGLTFMSDRQKGLIEAQFNGLRTLELRILFASVRSNGGG